MTVSVKTIQTFLFTAALVVLSFSDLFIFPVGGKLVFGHYIVLVFIIPFVLLRQPGAIRSVAIPLILILVSVVVNVNSAVLAIALFHTLHFIAIATLAAFPLDVVGRATRRVLSVLVVLIVVLGLVNAAGFGALLPDMLTVADKGNGQLRFKAFTTEPAAAGIVLLVLSRYVLLTDLASVRTRDIVFVLVALVLLFSLNGLVIAAILLATYFLETRKLKAVLILGVFIAVAIFGILQVPYFAERLARFDPTQGALGYGTATIRFLPYIYLGNELSAGVPFLVFGEGAGVFQAKFFYALGQEYTVNDRLAGHMAAMLYDYGLPLILAILLMYRSRSPGRMLTHLLTSAIVFFNSGIGTYLFILYGTFSLLEKRSERGVG